MEYELRNAFDKIHAGDALKSRTARYLHDEIQRRRGRAVVRPRYRLAAVCFSFLFFMVLSGVSYSLYFTPTAYVDMDVNPSIGLVVNRFSRVIDTHAFNDDGADVLDHANVRFKSYGEAVQILMDKMISNGYVSENGLVSVTVQANSNAENNMLAGLNQVVAISLSGHHTGAQADIFPVTADVRSNAHGHHVTPAMYLAITELQSVDPAVTFEGCRGHSIAEIRERTRGHGGGHHGNIINPPASESQRDESNTNGHHRGRMRGHHH
ncbi:MAG: hypothetical protein FWG94_11105 [Oscillospiraceae bacterium]|nr:hypothetical protein [Oscillospiraceae bacterium]